MNEALTRLKEDLNEFGPNNLMITVKRSDLQEVVTELFFKNEEWSNQSALGYSIAAAEACGLQEEAIKSLVRNMYSVFDSKTLEEAADVYRKSSY